MTMYEIKNTPLDVALSEAWTAIMVADHIDEDYAKVSVGTLQFILSEAKRTQKYISSLVSQLEEAQKTLEEIAYSTYEGPAQALQWREKANETLKMLKGETP